MAVFTPGNGIDTITVDSGELINTDDSLIDIDGDLIIDTVGNAISIGGGVLKGNTAIIATLTPSDKTTTTVTVGNDITPVTWE